MTRSGLEDVCVGPSELSTLDVLGGTLSTVPSMWITSLLFLRVTPPGVITT